MYNDYASGMRYVLDERVRLLPKNNNEIINCCSHLSIMFEKKGIIYIHCLVLLILNILKYNNY